MRIEAGIRRGGWRGWGAVVAILCCSGCATTSLFNPYPNRTEPLLRSVESGRPVHPERSFGPLLRSADRILYLLEAGRLAQLQGNFESSRRWYGEAAKLIRARDDEAMIRLSEGYGEFSAVLINDNAIPYHAEGYERVMLHLEQALNYLLLGNLEGAGVEVRIAAMRQAEAERRREREIEAARRHEREWQLAQSASLQPVQTGLDRLAAGVKSSFLNGYVFYVSAVVRELLGDENGAYIDYKKAAELQPDNRVVRADVLRGAERLAMTEDWARFRTAWPGAIVRSVPPGSGEVILFFEEEFLPFKQEATVWVPLPSGWTAVALPVFSSPPSGWPSAELLSGNEPLGRVELLTDLTALAARALQERMPAIATRQIVRAVAKGAAVEAASRQKGGEWAALFLSLYNLISERADLRNWTSLPARASVWRGAVPAGEHRFCIRQGDRTSGEWSTTVGPGGRVILWGYRTGRRLELHGAAY